MLFRHWFQRQSGEFEAKLAKTRKSKQKFGTGGGYPSGLKQIPAGSMVRFSRLIIP
jgi:hypothetical protein